MDTIWWPSMCGDSSDPYDAFWSWELTLNTTVPDLSRCLQNTAMTWASCLLIWILSLIYVPFLTRKDTLHRWGSISRFNLFKLVVVCLLVCVSAVDLVYYLALYFDGEINPSPVPAHYIAAALKIITFVWAAVLTHYTYRKGIHSSGPLWVFWLLSLVCGLFTFRSKLLQLDKYGEIGNLFTFITFYVYFALLLVQFICALFPDLAAKTPDMSVTGANTAPAKQDTDETTPLLAEPEPTDQVVSTTTGSNPCPKDRATFLSILTFFWFWPTVVRGYKTTLSPRYIWDLQKENTSEHLVPKFERIWNEALDNSDIPRTGVKAGATTENKKTPSLMWALFRTNGWYFMSGGACLFLYDFVILINPMILQQLISYVETDDPYEWKGYVYAAGMFVVSLIGVLCLHHNFNIVYTTGMRNRTVLTSAIYRKAMRLSALSRHSTTVGEIVNLMSVDTQKLQDMPLILHYIWSSPLIIALAMAMLWQILGPACMAGLGFMIIVLPLNSLLLAKKLRALQKEQMRLKDKRIKLMNQVLSGIKVLKFYAWEPYFQEKVTTLRNLELKALRKASVFFAMSYILWFSSPFLVALCCFAAFVLSSDENILDANKAFVSMSLFVILNFPLTILPSTIFFLVQAIVSVRRIEKFLFEVEVNPDDVKHEFSPDKAIKITDGEFSWGQQGRTTLHNIDLEVKKGELVAVVGQVGTGKSSLISAILGEMQKLKGQVNVTGSMAYVPQQPWIQNLTLKENVLFTRPLNPQVYDNLLGACALKPDIQILPGGDQTEIGERGINLSGGQKQRVSLARAVYQDADIYLLDDPLSAVDAHVGKHIFQHVVGREGLLKDKTRLLCTNSIQILPDVDRIVVLTDQGISEVGTYEELLARNGAFADFLNTYLNETATSDKDISDPDEKQQLEALQRQLSSVTSTKTRTVSHKSNKSHASSHSSKARSRRSAKRHVKVKADEEHLKEAIKERSKLITEEEAGEGAVKLKVVMSYIRAASKRYAVTMSVSVCFFIAAQCCTNIWLSEWSQDQPVNGTQDTELTNLRLGVYGGLAAAQSLSVMGLAVSIALGAVSASQRLHRGLLVNILKCPMSFFDTTPLGRVVNRFSKDTDIIDVNIPQFTQNLMTTLAPLISTLIIITYSIPIFAAVAVPLMILFFILQRVYVACARQIKRIDSVKKSPIFAFFSETLNGVSSIRAYQQQSRFVRHSDNLLDVSQGAWFASYSSNRWIGIWAEFIGDLILLSTALLLVANRYNLTAGLVGMALSFAQQINMNLVMTVRSSCELETYLVAVERVKEYTEVDTESDWVIPEKRPPREWPSEGLVRFNEYQTRYREGLDLVLKGITFDVKPCENVGIVGRTGAGKSSLTLALFRLIEAAGGSIQIDGQDIAQMGLHDVRSKLTIIPQDPVLFSGSIRFNLDPSDQYSDEEVWQSLQQSHMKDFVISLPETLEYECGEEGENLSVGQRQLLCLSRALLRKSKILVLDEATAAVDLETDDLIQSTIRSEFSDSTVLTIAHRLNTIMDYNRVVVMDNGKVVEYDAPQELLKNNQSAFYQMAKDAGLV